MQVRERGLHVGEGSDRFCVGSQRHRQATQRLPAEAEGAHLLVAGGGAGAGQPSRASLASPIDRALMASMCAATSTLRVLGDQRRPSAQLARSCFCATSTVPYLKGGGAAGGGAGITAPPGGRTRGVRLRAGSRHELGCSCSLPMVILPSARRRAPPGEAQLQVWEVAAPHLGVAHQPEGDKRAKRYLHGCGGGGGGGGLASRWPLHG